MVTSHFTFGDTCFGNTATLSMAYLHCRTWTHIPIGGSKGGRQGRPPPGVQILSISCSFGGKMAK